MVNTVGKILATLAAVVLVIWITTWVNTGRNMFDRFHLQTPIYIETVYVR